MKKFNKNYITITLITFFLVGTFIGPITVLAAGPATVDLGAANNFVILTKTGISTTGNTSITGDIGTSPAAASYITGFSLTLPAASAYSTSALVTGKVYASDYANPTPANLTTAILNMQTAYTDAAGRTNPTATELGAGNIGGMTLAPGLYKWSTNVTIPTDVTLAGSNNDIWIFQVAQNLSISSATKIILANGANPNNIFWIVAGQTTIGTTAVFNGNILDQTSIVLNTGATLNGRALAQTAVTLDSNSITIPTIPATPATPATSAIPATLTTPTTPTISATPATPATPSTSTNNSFNASDRAALIEKIQTLITLRKIISAQNTTNTNVKAIFNRNLTIGTTGDDVKALQIWLNNHGYTITLSGPGSLNNETKIFANLTRKALIKLQTQVGISATGYFGPTTRAYLIAHP
ncbi:MAG: ice-binding family protein [Candidatus Paceibacterota bacterium]